MRALVGVLALTGTATAGIRYEAMTVTSNDSNGTVVTTKVEVRVDGENTRIDFRELDGPGVPGMGEGGHLVSTDGGKTLFIVNPQEKTYMAMSSSAMLPAAGSVESVMAQTVSIRFDRPKVEDLGSAPGETMHGFTTTKVKRRVSYDMGLEILGMEAVSHVDSEQEMWLTTEIPDAGFGVWMRSEPPATGIDGLDEVIASQATSIKGSLLKSITRTRTSEAKGKRTSVTRTVQEVTAVEEVELDLGLFVIPANYERVDMPTGS